MTEKVIFARTEEKADVLIRNAIRKHPNLTAVDITDLGEGALVRFEFDGDRPDPYDMADDSWFY